MRVLKFGGSSVADAGSMSKVLDIVEDVAQDGQVLVVSSAISGCTDALVELGKRCAIGDYNALDIIKDLKDRHFKIILRLFSGRRMCKVTEILDDEFNRLSLLAISILNAGTISESQATEIQTFGELFSTRILAAKLEDEFYVTRWIDSRELIVKGDLPLTYSNIRRKLSRYGKVNVFVAPGFVAKDCKGQVTTLGRGGSDFSAALYAAALKAPAVEIWTDVPGIMTANPKVVPQARNIPHMSYDCAFCMASHGAKVLYAPTVAPAMDNGIPIEILNTFHPCGAKTTIDGTATSDSCKWMGISSVERGDYEDVYVCAEGTMDVRNAQYRGISAFKEAGISSINSSSGDGYVCFTVLKPVAREACITLHNEFL